MGIFVPGKKGFGIDSQTMLYIALVIIVLGGAFFLIGDKIIKPAKGFSTETLKLQVSKCQADVKADQMKGVSYVDYDRDNCLDTEDPCLGGDMKDTDLDGLPDACDKDPNNPAITACKGGHQATSTGAGVLICCTPEYMANFKGKPGYIQCK